MKFVISEKGKKDVFISLFQLLKNCATAVNITINDEFMYIQGMDKAHICLYEIRILASWFDKYEKNDGDSSHICVPTAIFHKILSIAEDFYSIMIHYDGDQVELVNIDFVNEIGAKGETNKYFKIPLMDIDEELLHIPEIEYEAEFCMKAKKVSDIMNQLLIFGNTINIICNEESVHMGSSGENGEMKINIPIDDLLEFSISEGDTINLSYSLNNIQNMCMATKISTDIEFAVSNGSPMRIKYNLGSDSYIRFYIAPKIED